MTDGFDEECDSGDLRITVEPREEAMARFGIDSQSFEEALWRAFDHFEKIVQLQGDQADIPAIEEWPIVVGNRTFLVKEIADVTVSNDEDFEESE